MVQQGKVKDSPNGFKFILSLPSLNDVNKMQLALTGYG